MTWEYLRSSTFEIVWPRQLVAVELDRLLELQHRRQPGSGAGYGAYWYEQVEHFVQEAFANPEAVEEWKLAKGGGSDWAGAWDASKPQPLGRAETEWLRLVRQGVDELPLARPRPLYWSQRRRGDHATHGLLDLAEVARRIAELVRKLKEAGYLVWAFGQECVDGDAWGVLGEVPADALHAALGREGLWPIDDRFEHYTADDLLDVIEFLADHVRRPTRSWPHSFGDCGQHYDGFDRVRGLQVYQWRINEILQNSELEVMLGEQGRLERTAPAGVERLVMDVRTVDSVHDADTDELHHALESFRARDASILDRRHAVIALAGILEQRRDLLKNELLSKDEGALFTIANDYAIRHQKADQRSDYDAAAYLEWIFYWYLATIHLTNRITVERNTADALADNDTGACN